MGVKVIIGKKDKQLNQDIIFKLLNSSLLIQFLWLTTTRIILI